jgi:hypothetical protein
MHGSFFEGFEKRAKGKPRGMIKRTPPMLARSISAAGPRLSEITAGLDRGRFGFFRG